MADAVTLSLCCLNSGDLHLIYASRIGSQGSFTQKNELNTAGANQLRTANEVSVRSIARISEQIESS